MSNQVFQAELDIDAPPAAVWALISDLRLMPKWSPQCRVMKALGPVEPGTKTVNLNRRKFMFWPTTCLGGVPSFERELVDGMNSSLTRIKAAAEGR